MSQSIKKSLQNILGGIYKIKLTPINKNNHQFVVSDGAIFNKSELLFDFDIEVGLGRANLSMEETSLHTYKYVLEVVMPGDNIFYSKHFQELKDKDLILSVTDNNMQTRIFGNYHNPVKLSLTSNTGSLPNENNDYTVSISVEMQQQAPYFLNTTEIPDYLFLSQTYYAYDGQTEFVLPTNAKGVNMVWVNNAYTTAYNYNAELSLIQFTMPLSQGDKVIVDFIALDITTSENTYYELAEESFFATEGQITYTLSGEPNGIAMVLIDNVRVKYFEFNSVSNEITFDYPLYEGNEVNIIYLKKY